jgi:hypothetical protein
MKLWLTLICLVPLIAPAQTQQLSKWRVGVTAGPDFAFYRPLWNDETGFTTGISLHRDFGQHLGFSSSLSWSRATFDFCGCGFIWIPIIAVRRDLVELSVNARYQVDQRRLSPHLQAGLGLMLQKMSVLSADEQMAPDIDFSTFLSSQLRIGLSYAAGRRLDISMSPTLRISASRSNGYGDLNVRQTSLGLVAELTYRFARIT